MTINRFRHIFFTVVVTLLLAAGSVSAGERSYIAGISMGRVFVASSRGLEAIGTNPANLTLPHRGRTRDIITESISHDTLIVTKDSTGRDTSMTISVSHDTTITIENEPPTVSFSFPAMSFGMNFGSDFINYEIYKKYFTGITDSTGEKVGYPLNDEDKNNILGVFPSGLALTHFDYELRYFGLTFHHDVVGEIGFSMIDRVSVNFDVPRDYVRFFFFGLDSTGSSYDFSGTNVRGWYLREYALSYARKLPMLNYKYLHNVSAGVGFKVVHGFAVAITDKYNATFSNRPNPEGGWDLVGNFDSRILRSSFVASDSEKIRTPFPAPAGTGIGIDLGVAADVYQGIRAALSITDIGSINWTKNTKETNGIGSFVITNPTQQSQIDSLKDAFTGKDTATGEFSVALPTSMRFGAAVQVDQLPFVHSFPGQLLLSIEYHQGFNESPGNTTRARLGLGAEYRLVKWFPIRTGITTGGLDRFNWAGGFGFDFGGFNWNFGSQNIGLLFSSKNWDQASFGMSMIIRI